MESFRILRFAEVAFWNQSIFGPYLTQMTLQDVFVANFLWLSYFMIQYQEQTCVQNLNRQWHYWKNKVIFWKCCHDVTMMTSQLKTSFAKKVDEWQPACQVWCFHDVRFNIYPSPNEMHLSNSPYKLGLNHNKDLR